MEQLASDCLSAKRLVYGQPRQSQNWKGITRKTLSQRGGNPFSLDFAGNDSYVARNAAFLDRHVCHADVVTKLILPGVLEEESIKIGISAKEGAAIIRFPECSNFHGVSSTHAVSLLASLGTEPAAQPPETTAV
jgi:hypothetical protein